MKTLIKLYWDTLLQLILAYPWTVNKVGVAVVVATTLAIGILGIKLILGFLFFLIAFIIGLSFRFYHDFESQLPQNRDRSIPLIEMQSIENTSKEGPSQPNQRPKLDMRITGSALIDETIHDMIDYILRDYVHIWYDHISNDDEFIYDLRKAIQDSLVTLASRIKEVDWIPYLTTQLVDDAATHFRLYRQALAKIQENPNSDLISVFFDLEASMEKNLCRDMVCTDDAHLADYFQGLTEVLLYLIIPPEVYACAPIGILVQDLLVNHVFIPLIHLLSEPDFVNQTIIWLCKDFTVTTDIYMSVINTTDTIDELFAAQGFFNEQVTEMKKSLEATNSSDEINTLRQQLKCLSYVRKRIEHRISHLKEGKSRDWIDETDGEDWQHYFMQPGLKLHTLTLEEVLKNSVALSYFLDYMSCVGGNHYLLMYLNADAWRVSAEQQLDEIEISNRNGQHGKDRTENHQEMLNCMRDAAFNVYEQFLSEKAVPRVKLGENVVKKFYVQVRTEPITAGLFDQIQESLVETLQSTDKFYPAFTRNKLYIKCLMELDLLKAETVSAHSQSSASDEEEEEDDLVHVDPAGDALDPKSRQIFEEGNRKTGITNELVTCRECLKVKQQESGLRSEELLVWEKAIWSQKYQLKAEIIEVALTVEKGNLRYGIYVIRGTRIEENGGEKGWHVYRRYSDFYDFHHWIKTKWMRLNKLDFPSKQTFGKTDRAFLEKRMIALNKYLSSIWIMTTEPCFGESLQDSLLHFLEPGVYVNRKKQFSEKIDSLVNMTVNPLKQSVKSVTHAVKTMPDTLFNTVDSVTKIFNSKNPSTDFSEAIKVGASLDSETLDNIPLRIIILLMDEVFDLKSRNQWLRRRILLIIRQIIKTMIGDNLNRRILDYVAFLTSPVRVSGYLKNLQHTLWPGGCRMSAGTPKDSETKFKTRIAAKASLLSSLSDELKHVIGSETTRRGLLGVFDLCQNRVLNRRLLLVLYEGIIKTLYPDKPFSSLIQRLHFRSNRVGKSRPFFIPPPSNSTTPSTTRAKSSTLPIMANLSPRGIRKRKL